jgi:hypothetical protein
MEDNKSESVPPSEGKRFLCLAKISKNASPAEIRKIAEEMAGKMIESMNLRKGSPRSECSTLRGG